MVSPRHTFEILCQRFRIIGTIDCAGGQFNTASRTHNRMFRGNGHLRQRGYRQVEHIHTVTVTTYCFERVIVHPTRVKCAPAPQIGSGILTNKRTFCKLIRRIDFQHERNDAVTTMNGLQSHPIGRIILHVGNIQIREIRINHRSIRIGRRANNLIEGILVVLLMHYGRTGHTDGVTIEDNICIIRGVHCGVDRHTGALGFVNPISIGIRTEVADGTNTVLGRIVTIQCYGMISRSSWIIEVLTTPDDQHLVAIDSRRSPVIMTMVVVVFIHPLHTIRVTTRFHDSRFDERQETEDVAHLYGIRDVPAVVKVHSLRGRRLSRFQQEMCVILAFIGPL